MENSLIVDLLTSIATLASIVFVIIQLRQSVNQEVRELIAEYNIRYLKVTSRIPYAILVENRTIQELQCASEVDVEKIKRAIFDYFLLCEEQLLLLNERSQPTPGRALERSRNALVRLVRDVGMWNRARQEWRDGMHANFTRHAIHETFGEICASLKLNGDSQPFSQLSRLVQISSKN